MITLPTIQAEAAFEAVLVASIHSMRSTIQAVAGFSDLAHAPDGYRSSYRFADGSMLSHDGSTLRLHGAERPRVLRKDFTAGRFVEVDPDNPHGWTWIKVREHLDGAGDEVSAACDRVEAAGWLPYGLQLDNGARTIVVYHPSAPSRWVHVRYRSERGVVSLFLASTLPEDAPALPWVAPAEAPEALPEPSPLDDAGLHRLVEELSAPASGSAAYRRIALRLARELLDNRAEARRLSAELDAERLSPETPLSREAEAFLQREGIEPTGKLASVVRWYACDVPERAEVWAAVGRVHREGWRCSDTTATGEANLLLLRREAEIVWVAIYSYGRGPALGWISSDRPVGCSWTGTESDRAPELG